jgi:hypothetical protein
MEFKTKAALTAWADDHTMAEMAELWNDLPGAKPIKKFEDRETGVARISAVLNPEPANNGL